MAGPLGHGRPAAWAGALVVGLAWLGAAAAKAAPAVEESIDDPKLSRRLGSRFAAPPAGSPSASPPSPPVSAPPPGPPAWPRFQPPPVGPPVAGSQIAAPAPALAAQPPQAATETAPILPRAELAFRRFTFVQLGAAGSASGRAADEPFDSLSLDLYPLSSLIRLGFSTQYGWQEGHSSGGDYLAAESFSAGVQLGGRQVVPFAEGFAGVGYLRRRQFDRTIPTAFWEFGVDAGVLLYWGRLGFASVALGYLRPINGFAEEQSFASVYTNTWSLKLGVGL